MRENTKTNKTFDMSTAESSRGVLLLPPEGLYLTFANTSNKRPSISSLTRPCRGWRS